MPEGGVMADSKSKRRRASVPKRSKPKAARKAAVDNRTARDVPAGPPSKRIDFSLEKGTRETLSSFRSKVGWQA
jgi:hypothetical protein